MIEIPLSKHGKHAGKYVAIVDDEDFALATERKWTAQVRPNGNVYAAICVKKNGVNKKMYLHRIIARARDGQVVDHSNGNPLDNRRCNLRICTQGQNLRNQKLRKDNTSGYKGVSYSKFHGKFVAYISVDNKRVSLGLYKCAIEAAKKYDIAAKQYHGQFALLNFPNE